MAFALKFYICHHNSPKLESNVAYLYIHKDTMPPWKMVLNMYCQGSVFLQEHVAYSLYSSNTWTCVRIKKEVPDWTIVLPGKLLQKKYHFFHFPSIVNTQAVSRMCRSTASTKGTCWWAVWWILSTVRFTNPFCYYLYGYL